MNREEKLKVLRKYNVEKVEGSNQWVMSIYREVDVDMYGASKGFTEKELFDLEDLDGVLKRVEEFLNEAIEDQISARERELEELRKWN